MEALVVFICIFIMFIGGGTGIAIVVIGFILYNVTIGWFLAFIAVLGLIAFFANDSGKGGGGGTWDQWGTKDNGWDGRGQTEIDLDNYRDD